MGSPAQHSTRDPAARPTEAQERARPTSRSSTGAVRSGRAGRWPRHEFKCIRGVGARGCGGALPLLRPFAGVQGALLFPGPLSPAFLATLGCQPGARTGAYGRGWLPTRAPAPPRPGPMVCGPPKTNVEAPPGKEVRLPLHAAPSGIWNRQEIAQTRSLSLCSQPSLY